MGAFKKVMWNFPRPLGWFLLSQCQIILSWWSAARFPKKLALSFPLFFLPPSLSVLPFNEIFMASTKGVAYRSSAAWYGFPPFPPSSPPFSFASSLFPFPPLPVKEGDCLARYKSFVCRSFFFLLFFPLFPSYPIVYVCPWRERHMSQSRAARGPFSFFFPFFLNAMN